MALNLSTLTSSATSGDVLAEALTTADFLENVPVLRNLARGSQKGGDAKQSVSLNQPRALPLIKNPAGDLGGYLYIPNVSGNYATGPSVTIGSNETWEGELDMVVTQWGNWVLPMGGGDWDTGFGLIFYSDKRVRTFSKGSVLPNISASGVTLGTPFNAKFGFDGTNLYVDIDNSRVYELVAPDQSGSITHPLELNQQAALTNVGNYAIQKAKLTVNNAVVFDCDFNGSTSIRHGDTKFKCATGQVVTINKSGNDPATVIKKPVLRFSDAASTSLGGVLASNLTEGYYFAALSFLGSVGSSGNPRLFSVYNSGDTLNDAIIFGLRTGTSVTTGDLSSYKGGTGGGYLTTHTNMGARDRGDVLHEVRYLTDGSAASSVNNSLDLTASGNDELNANKFILGRNPNGAEAASFDLEYLALFPASITDAQADAVRNYINKRNNVFYRWDTDGYYFFDPQKATFTGNFTAANTLDGYITGSDLGDTDVRTNLTLEQGTLNDQPSTDGYKITFNDSAEHLEFVNGASQALAGWQIVGTSLGTFAYRVNANAVTELNLLGNLGSASYRQAGDLYGIILLPESATGADIEEARNLLIDRGAADGVTTQSLARFWRARNDIVEFGLVDTSSGTDFTNAWRTCSSLTSFPAIDVSSGTSFQSAWRDCSSLTSFPAINASSGTNFIQAWSNCSSLTSFPAIDVSSGVDFTNAWQNCSSLTSFPAIDASSGTNFTSAWQGCSSLTSFPAGAKLGTDAENVNFSSAWQSSGLTSFSTPLPTATNASYAWYRCTSLTSFSSELPSVNSVFQAWYDCFSLTSFSTDLPSATNVNGAWLFCSSLESFSTDLPSATSAGTAWRGCTSLTSFSTPLPSVTSVSQAWRNCSSLTDFAADVFANWNPSSLSSGVFNLTWENCTSLTAQSVENILTSIDASGKYATTNGASGGTALADAGIDIDYNGDPLSAATTAAIDSLSGKGWQVYINGELVIPNILDLEPAAAYSLRSFDADADPTVVNVRRSSDGTTSDFKASEVSDGTLTDWVGAGNNGHVTTWYDQGGTNHATQSTASNQPLIVENGVLLTDSSGNPAIIGDGVDDKLAHPTLTESLDNSDFLVAAAFVDDLDMGINGAVPRLYMRHTSMSYNNLGIITYTAQTGRKVMSFQVDGATQEVFSNGVSLGTASEAQVDIGQPMFNLQQGGSDYSSGPLMEVVVFDANQSANRAAIEKNINDTYTIY